MRLVLSASELALLPFELALAPAGFPGAGQPLLLQSVRPVTITRETRRVNEEQVVWPDRTRVLFVVASPAELPPPPAAAHLLALRRMLEPWIGTRNRAAPTLQANRPTTASPAISRCSPTPALKPSRPPVRQGAIRTSTSSRTALSTPRVTIRASACCCTTARSRWARPTKSVVSALLLRCAHRGRAPLASWRGRQWSRWQAAIAEASALFWGRREHRARAPCRRHPLGHRVAVPAVVWWFGANGRDTLRGPVLGRASTPTANRPTPLPTHPIPGHARLGQRYGIFLTTAELRPTAGVGPNSAGATQHRRRARPRRRGRGARRTRRSPLSPLSRNHSRHGKHRERRNRG